MRTCPNCGHMLNEKDTICFKCGMQLSQISKTAGPMNNRQQQPMMPMNNRMNPKAVPMRGGAPKKMGPTPNGNNNDKNKVIFLVLAAVVVLAIVIGVIVFVNKNSEYEDKNEGGSGETVLPITPNPDPEPDPNPDPNPNPDPEPDPNPDPNPEPKEPTPPTINTECGNPTITEGNHLVQNNGYGYAVPDEYTAKDYGTQGFDILNYQKSKEMLISISKGTVANLKNTLPAVKQMYIDSGAVVHTIKVTEIAGVEVICVELTKNGQNMIIGITNAAEGEIFVVAVYNVKTNEVDYDIL